MCDFLDDFCRTENRQENRLCKHGFILSLLILGRSDTNNICQYGRMVIDFKGVKIMSHVVSINA